MSYCNHIFTGSCCIPPENITEKEFQCIKCGDFYEFWTSGHTEFCSACLHDEEEE